MHRIEQVFALSIDVHAQFLALGTQPVLQFSYRQLRTRSVGDDHHRKLSLHHGLIDVDYAAVGGGKYLRHSGDDSRMIETKD